MTKKPFVVTIDPSLWEELNLDDEAIQHRVLCGYFLNYGPEAIRTLVEKSEKDMDVTELLRVAPLLGLSARDRLVKTQRRH